MVNLDPSTVHAGPSGAAVTWDFSSVAPSGGLSTTTFISDTSTVFVTSNVLKIMQNGDQVHLNENSTDTYVDGISHPSSGIKVYYTNYDNANRPVSYMSSFVDSYKVTIPATSTVGTGRFTQTGDGYGTLRLPIGTFTNVLRVKKLQVELDTIAGNPVSVTTVSYLWFDGVHPAPLFQLDSVVGVLSSTQTATYLSLPTGFATVQASARDYSGYFNSNDLIITGPFENSNTYNVVVYSIIGNKIVSRDIASPNGAQHVDVGRTLSPGIYLIGITIHGDPSFKEVIRVYKN